MEISNVVVRKVDSVINEVNKPVNKYDEKIERFFCDAVKYAVDTFTADVDDKSADKPLPSYNETIGVVHQMEQEWQKLRDNHNTDVAQIVLPAKTFNNKNPKNYSVYYAFLAVYSAAIYYYRYNAKYHMKSTELEEALDNWNKLIHPKQKFSSMVAGMLKKRQK